MTPEIALRHAVLTGASSGIGAVIVTRLLREGWRVTGLSRTDPGLADDRFTLHVVDLLDATAVPAAVSGAYVRR